MQGVGSVEGTHGANERVSGNAGARTTSATALEVAVLREEVDVVNVRLDDVDERVTALEQTHGTDAPRTQDAGSPAFVGRRRGDESTSGDSEGASATSGTAPQATAAPPGAAPETPVSSLSTGPFQPSFLMVPLTGEQIGRLVGLGVSPGVEAAQPALNDREAQGEWRTGPERSAKGRVSRR